jgi:pimeloyl-ACP methyl ester carboxylesterase
MNASGARANKPELVLIHGWGLGPAAWERGTAGA